MYDTIQEAYDDGAEVTAAQAAYLQAGRARCNHGATACSICRHTKETK